jgi:hypothetical protein
LFILALWIASVRKEERNGEWQSHLGRMRRLKSGVWEYRQMTDNEIIDENNRDAWGRENQVGFSPRGNDGYPKS